MPKYQIGDRVRILNFFNLIDGVTGITGTVVSPDHSSDLITVQLDRLFHNLTTKRCEFLADELEYEDNRKDAAVGDLLASVGDVVVTKTMKSCQTERKQWMIWNTYFNAQLEITVVCPDCADKVKIPESDIANICYWNREPSEPLTMTYSNVGTNGI